MSSEIISRCYVCGNLGNSAHSSFCNEYRSLLDRVNRLVALSITASSKHNEPVYDWYADSEARGFYPSAEQPGKYLTEQELEGLDKQVLGNSADSAVVISTSVIRKLSFEIKESRFMIKYLLAAKELEMLGKPNVSSVEQKTDYLTEKEIEELSKVISGTSDTDRIFTEVRDIRKLIFAAKKLKEANTIIPVQDQLCTYLEKQHLYDIKELQEIRTKLKELLEGNELGIKRTTQEEIEELIQFRESWLKSRKSQ